MKVSPTQIEEIRSDFATMKSRQDLLVLLNKAKGIMYGEKAVPFELKQLSWYANPKRNQKRYKEFTIKKKSGGERVIHAPVKGLKSIQRVLAFILQCIYEPHQAATGFVRGKSIVDNARMHVGARYVYNIDLKDFFPSVDQARVWKCLQLEPFNLKDAAPNAESKPDIESGIRTYVTEFNETVYYRFRSRKQIEVIRSRGDFVKYESRLTIHLTAPAIDMDKLDLFAEKSRAYEAQVKEIVLEDVRRHILTEENRIELDRLSSTRRNLANLIASLCCTEITVSRKSDNEEWISVNRNVLPQGAPTSPVLTNVICQRLDRRLTGVAKRFGLKYSRYADDITFSSHVNVYKESGEFVSELIRIIKDQGFHINPLKTRLQKDGYRKEVTGLVVNEKVNVSQRYIKQIRLWLYYWERYGYEKAYSFFLQQYKADRGHVKKGNPDMANVIGGKLDYLKMVKREENDTYQGLKRRFDKLTGYQDPIDNILDIWEHEGIEQAIDISQQDTNG